MKYRAEIDGLRALAVIPVILFHAGFDLFSGGFIGVDVFFVISGYLITTILIEDIENKRFSLINFYERRARRILPALFLVMFACVPLAWMWMLPGQMKDFSLSLIAVSLFISNVLFWQESGYFDTAAEEKPLLHTWSLSIEEQYYVFFPVFLLLAWRFGKNRVFWTITILAAISVMLSEWGWRNSATANFYLFPTRAWELFAGSIAAFIAQKRGVQESNPLSLLGLAAIIFAVTAFDKTTPFPSIYTLVPVIGVVLLVLFAGKKTFAARLLGTKMLVGVGLISYSAYLWHQPLFAFFRIRFFYTSDLLMFGLIGLSFILAFFSWKFIEQPFRKRKSAPANMALVGGFIGLMFFAHIGMLGHQTNGFAHRFDDSINSILADNLEQFEARMHDCWEGLEKSPKVSAACTLGKKGTAPSFTLIGDSHAGALQSRLSDLAGESDVSGLALSYISCPPLIDALPAKGRNHADLNNAQTDAACKNLRQALFTESVIKSLPEVIIVHARWALLLEKERYTNNFGYAESGDEWLWDINTAPHAGYTEAMTHEIKKALEKLILNGKKLVIVYPVPEMGWSVPDFIATRSLHGTLEKNSGAVSYESFLNRNRSAYAALDSIGDESNVLRVYPASILCNSYVKQSCAAHVKGIPLYLDDDHLSDYGANLIAQEILSKMSYFNE